MAYSVAGAVSGPRVPGIYAALIEHQEAAVVKPDSRMFDWLTNNPDEYEASRLKVIADAQNQPKHSTLLDKLRAGKPVLVECGTLRPYLPFTAPAWLADPRTIVAVHPDDVVEPADGPPDQCQC